MPIESDKEWLARRRREVPELPPLDMGVEGMRVSRRGVIGGAVGAGAIIVGGLAIPSRESSVNKRPESAEALARHTLQERLEKSPELFRSVRELTDDYAKEMPAVLAYSDSDKVGELSCAEYFFHHVLEGEDANAMDKQLRDVLALLIPGISATEARYDNTRVSTTGAISRIQALPSTLKGHNTLHGETIYTKENIMRPEMQARLMREMLTDAYRMLPYSETTPDGKGWVGANEALESIAKGYFSGDKSEMNLQFLVPCIITSHQAGVGSVAAFARWAAEHAIDGASGSFDVFQKFAHTAAALPDEERDRFGFVRFNPEESPDFFARVCAFATLLDAERRKRGK